jgi:hypothetical protein
MWVQSRLVQESLVALCGKCSCLSGRQEGAEVVGTVSVDAMYVVAQCMRNNTTIPVSIQYIAAIPPPPTRLFLVVVLLEAPCFNRTEHSPLGSGACASYKINLEHNNSAVIIKSKPNCLLNTLRA